MQRVEGVARNVRRDVTVHGDSREVWTGHVLTFRIGKRMVELSMSFPPQIEDGDEVVVAGEVEQGVVVARAFYNFTNETYGHWRADYLPGCGCAAVILAFLAGALFVAIFVNREDGVIALGFGGLFGLAPSVWAYRNYSSAMKTQRAVRLVSR